MPCVDLKLPNANARLNEHLFYINVSMDAKFRGSYQRMEASLQKLTDSIAAYNPSDSASIELEKANAATQQNVAERRSSFLD